MLAALLGAEVAAAQDVLTVHLRPDPLLDGPPALVWVRQQLPRCVPAVRDVRAGLRVQVAADGVRVDDDDARLPAGTYLIGTLTAGNARALDLHCDDSGYETWRGDRARAELCAAVRELLVRTDVARPAASTAWVDVAVLVGLTGAGFETESPEGLLLTVGAAECGDLHLRASASAGDLVVEGRSRGGLTLPALLLTLARRNGDAWVDDEQRWIALAFAARDGRREEAAMQLARFQSRASERCLRALLYVEDGTRVRAIESLARRGACDALPAMVAAATGDADTTAAAAAALASLWPTCIDDVRAATRARAGADVVLRGAITRAETGVRLATVGTPQPRREGRSSIGAARVTATLLLTLTSLALLWRVLRPRVVSRMP